MPGLSNKIRDFVKASISKWHMKRAEARPKGLVGPSFTDPLGEAVPWLSTHLQVGTDLNERYDDYEMMDTYPEIATALNVYCLSGDTIIPLLSGEHKSLRELAESNASGFGVYSFDTENKKITAGFCKRAVKTGENKRVFKVTFDDGTEIKATENHEFITPGGLRRHLKDLSVGDSIIALIRLRAKPKGRRNYYEHVLVSAWKSVWQATHKMVLETINVTVDKAQVVHHVDYNSLNNDLLNLEILSSSDHKKLHGRKGKLNHKFRHDIKLEDMESILNNGFTSKTEISRKLGCSYRVIDRLVKELGYKSWEEMKRDRFGLHRNSYGRKRKPWTKSADSILHRKLSKVITLNPHITLNKAANLVGRLPSNVDYIIKNRLGFKGYRHYVRETLAESVKAENHKIISIEYCGIEDVYCLYDVSPHHNFAVGSSNFDGPLDDGFIFVGNSDDATQYKVIDGKTVRIECDDQQVKEILDVLFDQRLEIDEHIWDITRSLSKYGNEFIEIILSDEGVVGMQSLPARTMRRIHDRENGMTYFVQDISGKFGVNGMDAERMLAGSVDVPSDMAVWDDYEMVHMRLRNTDRDSVYGACLPADSLVWTVDGIKPISEIEIGSRVLCRHAGMLRTTAVVDSVCNGVKKLFKMKTDHREIRATANHPFLVKHGGLNRWCNLEDLKVGDEILISTHSPIEMLPPLGLKLDYIEDNTKVVLTPRCVDALRLAGSRSNKYGPRSVGLSVVFKEIGITKGSYDELMDCKSSISLSDLRKLLSAVGLDLFDGAFSPWLGPGVNRPNLPDFVDEDFCRFWGFMLGDGWVSNSVRIGFACGVHEDINNRYKNYIESIGLDPTRTKDSRNIYVDSTVFATLMENMGWANGSHSKRIPSWVFCLPRDLRIAFLHGFVDADGWATHQSNHPYYHTELCNYELVRDLKNLIDGLGWTCGNIRRREARESLIKDGLVSALNGSVQEGDKVIKGGPTYLLTWHETALSDGNFAYDKVKKIEEDGEEEVFDLGVADTDHNFVCDGVVVHNSTVEPARWIWKRLVILEDSALMYRLSRSPSRFAYYIFTGDMPPERALAHVDKIRQKVTKRRFWNPHTNTMDLRYNPLSFNDDFWVPVMAGGQDSTRIDVLSGPTYQLMDDIEYFRSKLYTAIMIPKAYLGFTEAISPRSVLSMEDVRFARLILRIQRQIRNGLKKIARVHLAARGIDPNAVEFKIDMTMPSGIYELAQVEVDNAKLELASRIEAYVSQRWIMTRLLGFTDDEVDYLRREKAAEEKGLPAPTDDLPFISKRRSHRTRRPSISDSEESGILTSNIDDCNLSPKAESEIRHLMEHDKALATRITDLRNLTHEMRTTMIGGRNGRIR